MTNKTIPLALNGWCVMLFSTPQIVRGEAYGPPKKSHKDLYDKCKNRRGVRIRQIIDKNAISSDLKHFEEVRPV